MKTQNEVAALVESCGSDLIKLLQLVGVLYVRPHIGERIIGPLVGRASTYPNPDGSGPLNYVSENYFNPNILHQYPLLMKVLAEAVFIKMKKDKILTNVLFYGVCEKDVALASELIKLRDAEKDSSAPMLDGQVVLVQDVFDTLKFEQGIALAKSKKKKIAAACSVINPEEGIDSLLHLKSFGPVPFVVLLKQRLTKYQQNYPLVSHDVLSGNVIWDPKKDWLKLVKVMDEVYAPDEPRQGNLEKGGLISLEEQIATGIAV